MNTAHSPGPWEIDERFVAADPKHANYRIFAANQICELTKPQGFYRSPAETEANARLIAAAPELLQALSMLLNIDEYADRFNGKPMANSDTCRINAMARAAIAKATQS